jgi:hypothetical protein
LVVQRPPQKGELNFEDLRKHHSKACGRQPCQLIKVRVLNKNTYNEGLTFFVDHKFFP